MTKQFPVFFLFLYNKGLSEYSLALTTLIFPRLNRLLSIVPSIDSIKGFRIKKNK